MTEQEAIKSMENLNLVLSITDSERESVNMAINALEKQIPKKPIFEDGFIGVYKCPVCKMIVGNPFGKGVAYCPECGQAIDWSKG